MNIEKLSSRDAVDRFVDAWGKMGSLWGVNASTARVHALLMATSAPLGLDDIALRLKISRGNASMCLKDLKSWGVVKLEKEPGDRKDYYVTEPDVWKMFFAIARQRKRRELDPALEAVGEVVAALGEGDGSSDGGGSDIAVQARMKQMQDLLSTMSTVADQVFGDESRARYLLSFLSERKQ